MEELDKEIREIEEEIRETPYNKATEKHIGRLKAKLAKLKEEKIEKSKSKGGREGYGVEKSGDATVILVGFPSVGKSTLLNSLTGAEAEVADYEFTTLEVNPGTLKYKGANIQVLDVPGLISGASEGKGRGREIISVLRNADLLLMMTDPFEFNQYTEIKKELQEAGIRLNQKPPEVKIQKKSSSGLDISSTVELTMSEDEIKSILQENGVINSDVLIREDLDTDRLIDAVMKNREYLSAFVVVNKIDLVEEASLDKIKNQAEKIDEDVVYISAESGDLTHLKEKIFEELDFMRVYLKPKGGKADMEEPMILNRGASVGELCRKIHRDLEENFKSARIWGDSAKYPRQEVGKDHELADGDIVSIIS